MLVLPLKTFLRFCKPRGVLLVVQWALTRGRSRGSWALLHVHCYHPWIGLLGREGGGGGRRDPDMPQLQGMLL